MKLKLNNPKRKILILCAFIILTTLAGRAQIKVTGQVTDENGEPLPGTTVVVKGTQYFLAPSWSG